ncbi:hypothetical protein ACFQO1_12260 [Jejudonia soesokkakensis]|uniref:Phage tail collar domain-containing protein n=1 Tax=Jejudonia soesokkakensis TaxID=1323432 RepID=A0ABW2MXI8_9FLAO
MKLLILIFCFISTLVSAQVGIGTINPDPSTILHIESDDKGILIPNVSLSSILATQLDGTNTAVEGLLIYNTNPSTTGGDGTGYYYYTSSNRWEKIMTPSSEIGLAPIGSIIAWHGSLAGVGALPDGWQLCDGSLITDSNSPIVNSSTPNLNGNTTSNSGDSSSGRFLRGSNVSGQFQNDQTNNLFRIFGSGLSSSNSIVTLDQTGTIGYISTDNSTGGDSYGFQLRGVETRVTNMSVIWIIRIK